jgi:Peptidase family M1 domain
MTARGADVRARVLAAPLVLGLAALVTLMRPSEIAVAGAPPFAVPALDETGLPPLPTLSPRNANYTIDARLDVETHTVEGRLVLEWRNTSTRPVTSFPFHLYWNAFRNNLSTAARGERRRAPLEPYDEQGRQRRFGFTQVKAVRLLAETPVDLLPSLRYIAPDDGNADDRTVMEVTTPSPVAPGASARFEIEWTGRMPHGDSGRFGWVHDYHFVAQWFPKIGVLREDGWNSHQHHANTEFFADFGIYDVRLTLPAGFVLGATGRSQEAPVTNADGTLTHHYRQEDVHDFAWTCSRRFVEHRTRFEEPGYPPVDVRVLVQPEHEHLAARYAAATNVCLRAYGSWAAPYPYGHITVVDPAWTSASGGMEYPTFFTGGANVFAPPGLQSPEAVTVHECGHQFWYGLVATNEFEEAWLDEGFNEYHNLKADQLAFGSRSWSARYLAVRSGGRARGGWAWEAPGVMIERGQGVLTDLREQGESDPLVRRGWEYRVPRAYTLNSYGKPALVLQTLEGLLGDETMTRVMRTYARRYRFRHPVTTDFIAVVNEVTGQDWRWFFDQTFYSSDLCDYAVSVKNMAPRQLEGFADGAGGALPALAPKAPEPATKTWESEVDVRRKGGVQLPVELLVEFEDGTQKAERWDGRERWVRFRYPGPQRVVRAIVDPEHKLALDVDPSNNTWELDRGAATRAATKWSARFLLWVQSLLELQAVFA